MRRTSISASFVMTLGGLSLSGAEDSIGTTTTLAVQGTAVFHSLDELGLEEGTPIRVVGADGRRLEGRFQRADVGELFLESDEGVVVLPEDRVYQVWRVEKRRGKGALRGLLVGLGITAALGAATLTQATEEGEGGLGFGIGLMFAVPISVTVGLIVSTDRRELVYENPAFAQLATRGPPEAEAQAPEQPGPAPPTERPPSPEQPRAPPLRHEVPRSFYLGVSGGASLLGGDPVQGASAEAPGSSTTFVVRGLYRASERVGFGGEVLFTNAGTWKWETERGIATDSREIVAPGFKVFYFPVVGRNEITLSGGVSAFRQSAIRTLEGPDISQSFTETKQDPYLSVGASYRRFVHPKLGVGAEIHYYRGSQIPDPLVLFSVSLSFRATPPKAR
jgi:hypothetical protein